MGNALGPVLSPEEFKAIVELCNLDPHLPSTLQLWRDTLTSIADAQRELANARQNTYRDQFRAWCAEVDISPCLDALRAYVLIHRTPHLSSCYGAVELNSQSKEFGSRRGTI